MCMEMLIGYPVQNLSFICKPVSTFTLNKSLTAGPVFIEFPIDVLYPYELVKRELGSAGGSGEDFSHFFCT